MTGTDTTVLSLNLKKGSYFVTSKVYAWGTDLYAYARCQLIAPSGNTPDTSWWWSGSNDSGYSTLVNESVMHIGNTGTVQLRCSGDNATLYGKKLTAIRLASFSNLTGPDVAKVPMHRVLPKH